MSKKINILDDEHSSVELVNSMGDDLTVVNSARVSFAKHKEKFDFHDEKLLQYLIKNNHWSPFRHVMFQFHIQAPEMVARQWYKHCIGADYTFKDHAWNEVSGRYVELEDKFYVPRVYRKQSTDNKQASSGLVTTQETCQNLSQNVVDTAFDAYKKLLDQGVCREQARLVLPVSFYTQWWWTASLQAVLHFINLRDHTHAQWEIQRYATALKSLVQTVCPRAVNLYFKHINN